MDISTVNSVCSVPCKYLPTVAKPFVTTQPVLIVLTLLLFASPWGFALGQTASTGYKGYDVADIMAYNQITMWFLGLSERPGGTLELVPDQVEKIQAIKREWMEINEQNRLLFQTMLMNDPEQAKKRFAELAKRAAELQSEINEHVLLPHQARTLANSVITNQIGVSGGLNGWLKNPRVLEELKIDSGKQKELEQLMSQKDAEQKHLFEQWRKELTAIDQIANEQAIGVLESGQRSFFRESFGMEIEFAVVSLEELFRRYQEARNKETERADKEGGDRRDK